MQIPNYPVHAPTRPQAQAKICLDLPLGAQPIAVVLSVYIQNDSRKRFDHERLLGWDGILATSRKQLTATGLMPSNAQFPERDRQLCLLCGHA